MASIDKAINVVDPDFDIRSIKGKVIRKQNAFFWHGESTALLLDLMREAAQDLSHPITHKSEHS